MESLYLVRQSPLVRSWNVDVDKERFAGRKSVLRDQVPEPSRMNLRDVTEFHVGDDRVICVHKSALRGEWVRSPARARERAEPYHSGS